MNQCLLIAILYGLSCYIRICIIQKSYMFLSPYGVTKFGDHWLHVMACHLFGSKPLPELTWKLSFWTRSNILRWNSNQEKIILFQWNASESILCEMSDILLKLRGLLMMLSRRILEIFSINDALGITMAHSRHIEAETNCRHFTDDILKCIFVNENVWISITISLNVVPGGPINNSPPLVQIMAWRRPGDKPLSEPMMVGLPTHIYIYIYMHHTASMS